MKPIFEDQTAHPTYVYETDYGYLVRFVHSGRKGLTEKAFLKLRRIRITCAVVIAIFTVLLVSKNYVSDAPILSYFIALGLAAVGYLVFDFSMFIVSKILYRKMEDFDFAFDRKTQTVSMLSEPAIFSTFYLGWPIFQIGSWPAFMGLLQVEIDENAIFSQRPEMPHIDFRGGFNQSKIDFTFNTFNHSGGGIKQATVLTATLNKVLHLTRQQKQSAQNSPAASRKMPDFIKPEKPHGTDFNPMD